MRLEGKAALITGGTRGIGAATAIALAERGADIAIVGRHDDEQARETRSCIEAFGRRCEIIVADVGKPEEATRCVEEGALRFGTLTCWFIQRAEASPEDCSSSLPRPGTTRSTYTYTQSFASAGR